MTKSSKPENAADLARNIWLAGLGAYGKAWDQAQDRLEKAEKDTAKLFDDLVSKGQKIEKETQKKVQEVADLSGNFSIEDRLQRYAIVLGFRAPPQMLAKWKRSRRKWRP